MSNLVTIPLQPPHFVRTTVVITPVPPLTPLNFKNRKGLGLIHLNIRSLLKNFDHITILVEQTTPDILVLGETWLGKNIDNSDLVLCNYNFFRMDRIGKGGGVGIYVKSSLPVSILNAVSLPKSFEFLALKVQHGLDSLTVVGVYRPPSADSDTTATLVNMLSEYSADELLVMGDLNLNWLSDVSLQLKELMCDLNLSQLIVAPTRPNLKDHSKSTLIDLIFTNRVDKYPTSGVFELGVSDHCPIACIRDVHVSKTGSQVVSKRNFKNFDTEGFLGDINSCDWSHVMSEPDVQVALYSFIDSFNTVVNKHAPFKRVRIKDRVTPWFSPGLSRLFRDRSSAWSCARRSGDSRHWLAFRQIRNRCTNAVRKAKTDYYLDLVTNAYSNPAKFWSAVNVNKNKFSNSLPTHIEFNNYEISDKNDICQLFNQHFAEAGLLFDRNITGSLSAAATSQGQMSPHSKFSLIPFTLVEVYQAVVALDNKCSTGEDDLEAYFIKLAAPVITEQLTYIFNTSVASGKLPLEWKSASVLPLHKGGERVNLDNYRPISRLPCLAKVLESLVNKQFKHFLSINSVLSPHQSGFRAQHSTTSAITLVVNDISSALDNKKHCAALFIDLSKAFDTVDHSLLLHRLTSIGLDDNALSWFHDYLTSRRQCVRVGHVRSEFLSIDKGVPQGSVLGPVLFTIYLNNILSSLNGSCQAHLYADDTVIYCMADSVQLATENLQLSFIALQNALHQLKLVLNSNKTKFMIFSRAKNVDYNSLQISSLNGTQISRVTEYKYLGLWIDEKLTFKFHTEKLASKLRQKVGFLFRNRLRFPQFCRKRVVESIFLSVLDYGDVIYRHASASSLKPLDSVYHSALRFITGDRYDTHHCILYSKVGWPSLAARRDYHWLLYIFKALTGKQPPYIAALLDRNAPAHQTRSSHWITLKVPWTSTGLGRTAFSFAAPKSWNDFQSKLKLEVLPSLTEFKCLISFFYDSCCNCF